MTTAKAWRKTVMLVEDDDDERDALATLLEDADYQVLRARNGAEALRMLEATPDACDIILLDLMMPVMNGWDFRRVQKRRATLADIPVVLMSAGAQIAFAVEDLDAAGYLTKPVEVADLLEQVERHSNG
ncbi:MAG TPA: response regulator [Polyangia bacterium]|nr:response regulator [Polyangia bacterium]